MFGCGSSLVYCSSRLFVTENVLISSTLCLTSSTESFRQEFVSGLCPSQCWWRQHDKQISRDLLVYLLDWESGPQTGSVSLAATAELHIHTDLPTPCSPPHWWLVTRVCVSCGFCSSPVRFSWSELGFCSYRNASDREATRVSLASRAPRSAH